jgi:hypothetical protein
MKPNPDPGHITDEMWWFSQQLLALEPGTQFGGIFAPKAGYHNTRANLQTRPEWRGDYSIQLPADRRGPSDKSAAMDWTFPDAQAGNYERIRTYGARIADAFRRRDPRLTGWREVLIQADTDAPPEGFDFVTWTTRTPDDTHRWHGHFSCLREFVPSMKVMQGMLSVLGWKQPEEGDMATAYLIESADPKYNGRYYLSTGVHRRGPIRATHNIIFPALASVPGGKDSAVKLTDAMRTSVSGGLDWEQYLDAVAGPELKVTSGGAHTHEAVTTLSPSSSG